MNDKSGCPKLEWMVGPLVDGELPPAETESVERHLQECDSCRRLADDFRSFDRLAQGWERPSPVSPAEWEKVWGEVRPHPQILRMPPSRSPMEWLVPALSLAALLIFGAWIAFQVATKTPAHLLQEREAQKILKESPASPNTGPAVQKPGKSL